MRFQADVPILWVAAVLFRQGVIIAMNLKVTSVVLKQCRIFRENLYWNLIFPDWGL